MLGAVEVEVFRLPQIAQAEQRRRIIILATQLQDNIHHFALQKISKLLNKNLTIICLSQLLSCERFVPRSI